MATLPFSGPRLTQRKGSAWQGWKFWVGVPESQQAPIVGSVAEVQGEVGLVGGAWGGVFMRAPASLVWALVGRASHRQRPLPFPLPHPQ